MFEQPNAKRIRRSKVFDDGSSSDSDSEEVTETTTIKDIQDSIGLAYHFDYDLIENPNGEVTKFAHLQVDEPVPENPPPALEEETFDFRLFSTQKPSDDDKNSSPTHAPSTKINIRSPTPDTPSDGRFLNPHRPQSYYFAPLASPSLTTSALSGQFILSSQRAPWPGTHLPWRVIHLPSNKSALKSASSPRPSHRSGKPGKRRRILLRTRERAKSEKEKEKEAHLREKKTRLNREKKIKRKAKEKAMKTVQKGGGDVDVNVDGAADGDGDV